MLRLGLLSLLGSSANVLSDFHGLVLQVVISSLNAFVVISGDHFFELLNGRADLLLHCLRELSLVVLELLICLVDRRVRVILECDQFLSIK